uniref:O-antigen flippase n=1 Tax=Yersinia pseudotuberculosis TaxID=633 RepID=G4WJA8_YERPU|nr:O-antigen flippase [Yersinia pseudotuberculosis]
MKNRLILNTISNYIGVFWMGGGILILYPIYIKILGSEQWGVVSACISIQAMLMILDAGFAQIMPRDIAFSQIDGQENSVYKSYFLFYLFVSIIGCVSLFFFSGWLSTHWFQAGEYSNELEVIIKITSIQFLFQFLNNVNIGYWNGIQNQKITNISQVFFFTLKHVSALLVLLIYPYGIIYITVFTIYTFIEFSSNFIFIRLRNKVFICVDRVTIFKAWHIVRDNYRFSLGVIIGVCVSQLDRFLFSRQLTLKEYGVYIIVVQLGLSFLQLQYPVMKAITPALSARINDSIFNVVPLKYMLFLAVFTILPILITSFFSYDILLFWTNNQYIADMGHSALSLICLSVILSLPYGFVYADLIRKRKGSVILISNVASIFFMLIYFYCFADKGNIISGGVLWLIYSITSLTIGLIGLKIKK